jgi:hypothetical protein
MKHLETRTIARVNSCPDSLGYKTNFKAIVRAWHPGLAV